MTGTPGTSKRLAFWQLVTTRYMPFADVAEADVPLHKLLRLSLFQISAGLVLVLLTGTLNRIMVIELSVAVSFVSLAIAIPVIFAPLRVVFGHRSDAYRSFLGWRRVPYLWLGSLLQFGGLAIMPFALLLLNSQTTGPEWAGVAGACLAFMITGFGMHMAQTAGIALATDLVPEAKRPRIVALLYTMLLIGMILSSLVFGFLLADFSAMRLIQVIQGAAVATLILNVIALWKQEARNPQRTRHDRKTVGLRQAMATYLRAKDTGRLLVCVAIGTAAFGMQDVLLEPYGAEVLGLSVSQTTQLTALWALGTLAGFAYAGKRLQNGANIFRLVSLGLLIGIVAFSAIVFAMPLQSRWLFSAGTCLVGLGSGLFAVGTLLAAMQISSESENGLLIGAWGAVQATAIGVSLFLGGVLKDMFATLSQNGALGSALADGTTGYLFVYHVEIGLLFLTLIVMGRLTRHAAHRDQQSTPSFGLAEMPG